MAKPRFHTVAAFVVLAVSAAWVLTGEFSSIGSAANDAEAQSAAVEATPPRRRKCCGRLP